MKSFASEVYCRMMVYENPTAILAWLLGGEAFRELLASVSVINCLMFGLHMASVFRVVR